MRPISAFRTVRPRRRILIVAVFVQLSTLTVLADPIAIPTPTQQAIEYHNISNIAWGVNAVLTLLLPIAFLRLRLGTRISNKFVKLGRYLTFVIFATIFFALNQLIQLPLERIRTATRNQFESSPNLPILQWIFNQFLASVPLIVFSILAAVFVYWLINRSPRRWWLWATGVSSLLFLVFLVVEPFTISNKPIGESPVEVEISQLAEQIGVPTDSVVLEDCEPFDKCEIAHVTGLGPTRLLLLNKGIFQNYPESWTIQSFAHESKHFVKDDNLTGWIVFTAVFLFCFWALDQISRVAIKKFSGRLGFTSIGEAAALPLIILILNVIFLVALPPINLFRQHVEFEADRYGLELTHQNRALAEMASSWTTGSNLRMPNPSLFFMLFRSSHPSDAARISFANEYQVNDKQD